MRLEQREGSFITLVERSGRLVFTSSKAVFILLFDSVCVCLCLQLGVC